MAKAKDVNTAPPVATEGEAAADAAAPKKERKAPVPAMRVEKFKFANDPAAGTRIAPQAALIVKHVKAAGGDGVDKATLVSLLSADPDFKTRQPVERIIGYYQRPLIDAGVLVAA
jgi:hypothetical protein